MEDTLVKRREVFFNNLILLGIDKMSLEKKHNITFHKDMFVLPNKKGYEIVTYFLFSKLSSATGKDYNIPWPLVCKEHDRVFQKTCYSHLMNFSKISYIDMMSHHMLRSRHILKGLGTIAGSTEENCIKFPRIVPSLLSTFGGDRFYETYLAFSSYVLYKVIKKNRNTRLLSMPLCNQENYTAVKDILQLSTLLNMKKFQETEMISYSSYKIWLKFAKILEESLRKLKHLLRSYDELIKKKENVLISLYPAASDGHFNLSKVTENCFESLKPVLKQKKILDKFLNSEQKYWECLCSEVGETAESEFLSGQDYRIQLSDYLPEEYVRELKDDFSQRKEELTQKAGYFSSDENGKLSVEKFIRIFMVYLTYIVELLKKANLSELPKDCFVENASSIEDDLKCIKNLNKKLGDEVIPDLGRNIGRLKILSGYDNIENDLELSSDLFHSLPNPSYDNEAVKQRTSHFDADLEKIFNSSLEKQKCSKKDDSGVFLEKDSVEHSLTDQNITSTSSSSFISSVLPKKGIVVHSYNLDKGNLNSYSSINEVPTSDLSSSPKFHASFFEDPEFSNSSNFKMRESWLKEESLNAVTLPDMSFDEEI